MVPDLPTAREGITIGTGRDDPRQWVRAAYVIVDEMDSAGKVPAQRQVAARLGICPLTVARACRELAESGIIYLVPGYGYYQA